MGGNPEFYFIARNHGLQIAMGQRFASQDGGKHSVDPAFCFGELIPKSQHSAMAHLNKEINLEYNSISGMI